MERPTKVLTAIVLALALAACGKTIGPKGDYGGQASITPSTSSPGATSGGSSSAEGSASTDVGTFGQPWTYPDGLTVTVTAPEEFTTSTSGASTLPAVRLDVTVRNGTDQEFDPSLIAVGATSAGAAAEPIVDSGNGLNGSPEATLPPGEAVTYSVGFHVKDPTDVEVEVTPGLQHEASTFTG